MTEEELNARIAELYARNSILVVEINYIYHKREGSNAEECNRWDEIMAENEKVCEELRELCAERNYLRQERRVRETLMKHSESDKTNMGA